MAKGGPNKKNNCAIFQITLTRSIFSASAQNQDGHSSTLNPRREIQGQIIVCKTPLHSIKRERTANRGIILSFDLK